ncbi:MAG: peptide/nickel transport system permease protein [Clostridiales bacterium]|jgi:ABC-type dipeptide/oligopeptide/nickel transport system permease component|uniref:Peptide/nickel transport system permease protein n=1 Tax=Caldicoprobacter faecalis TaxID=937334 RepID=A0A1I5UU50_9FIRM|nr:ABC transporter permease [Caldicoprobacter faecalis]MDN5276423.1 peptide/nickel transport system permease protein [Clostridiales bacterium]PZN10240.1 MAG: ABC transporter permease [Caldicoprobacter oshimai]SFP98773.1 peptide/nickel transport system permease protein [Caldicoprobacter faecalis]
MLKYIVKRIVLMIPVVTVMTLIVFSIFYFAPGDPVSRIAGPNVTPEVYESIRRKYGLDQPFIIQYLRFMKSVIEGDLGVSILQERPVIEMIKERLPVTLEIGLLGFLITFLIAIPAGVIAAVKKNTMVDYLCMSGTLLGTAIPTFWLGMLLMYFFAYKLRWFPISGYGTIRHLILPSFAIGLTNAAITARMVRSSMLEVLKQDYVRTARSKGLLEKVVIYRHALKNALIPVITLMGLRLGWIIGGSVALEIIFSIPGIGRLMVDSILARDYPVVQGSMIVLTSSIILANILADILYAIVDPRIRYS